MFRMLLEKKKLALKSAANHPYYSTSQQMNRYATIAQKEITDISNSKTKQKQFNEMFENNPRLLMAVTPHKHVESLDGSFHLDVMTDIQLSR